MKPSITFLGLFILSLYCCSCSFTPVNNQFEKAGTLKKGNIELMGSFSNYSTPDAGTLNNNLGFKAGLGISENFDLKIRYENQRPPSSMKLEGFFDDGYNGKVNYFSLIPKFAVVPEKISVLVPLSYYSVTEQFIDESFNYGLFSITPQMIYTLTNTKNKADFSFGLKSETFISEGVAVIPGTTIGAGFSSDLSKWSVRPEMGASLMGGAVIFNYGIGLQFLFSGKKLK